jgi:hypothetical protein
VLPRAPIGIEAGDGITGVHEFDVGVKALGFDHHGPAVEQSLEDANFGLALRTSADDTLSRKMLQLLPRFKGGGVTTTEENYQNRGRSSPGKMQYTIVPRLVSIHLLLDLELIALVIDRAVGEALLGEPGI